MLHKHPSPEKAQSYFGITEKLKHDAANFFIYIQPKLTYIYDNSISRALGESFNSKEVRDKHVAHISTLLTGGIDHRFINESHQIRKKYLKLGVTTGEYIKLYQLIISYLSGEAHKKHWWRYKKYRDLNRSIRNLLLFDLAIATSPREVDASLHDLENVTPFQKTTLTEIFSDEIQKAVDELTSVMEKSYQALNECYEALQSALETPKLSEQQKHTLLIDEVHPPIAQTSLFDDDTNTLSSKAPSTKNAPSFIKILSLTQEKINKASELILLGRKDPSTLEHLLQEIQADLDKLSHINTHEPANYLANFPIQHSALRSLLQKSSQTIESNLNNLEELKEKQLHLK
jgi:hypothetical protein